MKVKLAQWRWRLVGITLAIVAVRIVAAVAWATLGDGDGPAADGGGRLALITALDALALALVGPIIAAFVLYGRIYRARVPTE